MIKLGSRIMLQNAHDRGIEYGTFDVFDPEADGDYADSFSCRVHLDSGGYAWVTPACMKKVNWWRRLWRRIS